MTKTCSKCKENKDISCFSKDSSRKDGLKVYCKYCSSKQNSITEKHKRETDKDWYSKKLEYGSLYKKNKRATDLQWREKVNFQVRECNKKRLKIDPLYKLATTLRTRANIALKTKKWNKDSKFAEYLGCTVDDLRSRIESMFHDNPETGEIMTWDNHTNFGWHLDHIVPLASASTKEELIKLFHYTNLQPLWWKKNLSKGDTIDC